MITIISRLIQAIALTSILILLYTVCDPTQEVNIQAIKWITPFLVGVMILVEFCKDLK